MQPDVQSWSQADLEGRLLYERADYDGAIRRWLDALVSIPECEQNARARAYILHNIGLCHSRIGDDNSSIRYLERALEEHYTAAPPTTIEDQEFRAHCLVHLGEAYRASEAYSAAADCFSCAADIAIRCENDELATESLIGWGLTAEAAGNLLAALNLLNRARQIARAHAVLADLESRVDKTIREMLLAASEL